MLHPRHFILDSDVEHSVSVTYRQLSKLVAAIVALCVVGAFPGGAQQTSRSPDPNEEQAQAGAQQPPGQQGLRRLLSSLLPALSSRRVNSSRRPVHSPLRHQRRRTPAWIFMASPCWTSEITSAGSTLTGSMSFVPASYRRLGTNSEGTAVCSPAFGKAVLALRDTFRPAKVRSEPSSNSNCLALVSTPVRPPSGSGTPGASFGKSGQARHGVSSWTPMSFRIPSSTGVPME